MRPDAMIFVFWMLNFKPAFSLSSFTFIKRLFSSSSVSAIRVVSYACLRLWYFSQQLIPACVSFRPAFYMVYSAFKLNKQGDNIQPCHTPFPILIQSIVSGPVLTVATWRAYRFLRRQTEWSGMPISQEFSTVCCDPHKGLNIINEAEVDVFLEFLAFSVTQRMYLVEYLKGEAVSHATILS